MRWLLLVSLVFVSACSDFKPASVVNPKEKELDLCENMDADTIDMACITQQLEGDGLGGWVHSNVGDQKLLVFTWRHPKNFFVNIQLPMVATDPEISKQLETLKRHDQILIKGSFVQNKAPIRHINVQGLKIVKAYEGPSEETEYDPALWQDIVNGTSMIAKVHIVANGGSVLVVEKGDRVIPVYNSRPDLVKDLFRNDKIELQYLVRKSPSRPVHLEVNTAVSDAVKVVERIEDGHDEEMTLTGSLVMFPQSPQIMFNVFALRQEDADGIQRNFTIVNFTDMDVFTGLRDMLQKAWDENVESAEYDRNKYINRRIQVRVKGVKNVVSPTQANPQIMPETLDAVEIEIL